MDFTNKNDEYFFDSLDRYNVKHDILFGSEFDVVYSRFRSKMSSLVNIKPMIVRVDESIPCTAYRVQSSVFFTVFYTKYKDEIGGPIYVVNELHGTASSPDTIFMLSTSVGIAASQSYKGGVNHVCFNSDFGFMLIRDQNSMAIGYGLAIPLLTEFRVQYPEFVV